MVLTFDVLVQFLVTLAVGEGFKAEETYKELLQTHVFSYLSKTEYNWAIQFITQGGATLKSYEEFHKVVLGEDGFYRVKSRRISIKC